MVVSEQGSQAKLMFEIKRVTFGTLERALIHTIQFFLQVGHEATHAFRGNYRFFYVYYV